MAEAIEGLSLTKSQVRNLDSTLQSLFGKPWSLSNPVFVLDRCWLRLEKIRLDELAKRLPPDTSNEAPELVKYHQLLQNGFENLLAIQECWLEFGMEDFYRALRNYWHWQDIGNNGWTFGRYLDVVEKYRKSFEYSSIEIPLIVLGRKHFSENHFVEWISQVELTKSINV